MGKLLSTYEISNLLSVDISTVTNWINSGKLKAFKTPGGHRRVLKSDFMDFIQTYNIPVKDINSEDLKILIVDDEEIIRKNIRRIVKKQYPKANIFEATNGFVAGTFLGQGDVKILLLDIQMPGMNGLEVMQYIKDNPNLGSPKIVVITGYPETGLDKRIKDLGAHYLLAKPFENTELLDIIHRLIS